MEGLGILFFQTLRKKNAKSLHTCWVESKEVYSIQEVEDIGSRTWQYRGRIRN